MMRNRSILVAVALCAILVMVAGAAVAVVLSRTNGGKPVGAGGGGGTGILTPTPTADMTIGPPPTPTPTVVLSPTRVPSPTPVASPVELRVLAVLMSVSPTSITGIPCGTPITVTYTATFYFPKHNEGGTVVFSYTVDGGHSTTQANVAVPEGVTSIQYAFSWSGDLPQDHTKPGLGGVMVTSPNPLTSQLIKPAGKCKFPS